VLLPEVSVARHARLTRVVIDHGCNIPEGMVIGEDPIEDAKRFERSANGVTLVTREMLERLG
jgi:glucose-1-phosphate adenylyltransferase